MFSFKILFVLLTLVVMAKCKPVKKDVFISDEMEYKSDSIENSIVHMTDALKKFKKTKDSVDNLTINLRAQQAGDEARKKDLAIDLWAEDNIDKYYHADDSEEIKTRTNSFADGNYMKQERFRLKRGIFYPSEEDKIIDLDRKVAKDEESVKYTWRHGEKEPEDENSTDDTKSLIEENEKDNEIEEHLASDLSKQKDKHHTCIEDTLSYSNKKESKDEKGVKYTWPISEEDENEDTDVISVKDTLTRGEEEDSDENTNEEEYTDQTSKEDLGTEEYHDETYLGEMTTDLSEVHVRDETSMGGGLNEKHDKGEYYYLDESNGVETKSYFFIDRGYKRTVTLVLNKLGYIIR